MEEKNGDCKCPDIEMKSSSWKEEEQNKRSNKAWG